LLFQKAVGYLFISGAGKAFRDRVFRICAHRSAEKRKGQQHQHNRFAHLRISPKSLKICSFFGEIKAIRFSAARVDLLKDFLKADQPGAAASREPD
jgi:hypothetical protein